MVNFIKRVISIIIRSPYAFFYVFICLIRDAGWVFYSAMNNLVVDVETAAEMKRRRTILNQEKK